MDEDRDLTQPEPGLAELIELERRIDVELRDAEAEAKRLVETARREARALREARDGGLDAELRALRERMLRECETSVRRIEELAELEVARFEGADAEAIDSLARLVVARLSMGDTTS